MPRVQCERCGYGRCWRLADGRRRCARCGHTFSTRKSKAEALEGRLVEYFCLGVPAYRLRFIVPLSRRTVERAYHRFREAVYQATSEELRDLSGVLELDEAAFGGRRHGRRGWGAPGKTLVFGIYKRNGRVHTFPVPDRKYETLRELIERHTLPGSLYFTDDYRGYASLEMRGEHVVVKKEKGRPVGRDHVNGIEGFWSFAKHWLYTYRGVHRDHFHLYLRECEWRFNRREENLIPLLQALLRCQK